MMEKIISKEELIESLKDTLAIEVKARDEYKFDFNLFKNKKIKDTYNRIEIEEEKHISLLKDLISMLG